MKTFVLTGDATYLTPIETVIKSILYHHKGVKIYFIHQDVSSEWLERLKTEVTNLGSVLEIIHLQEDTVQSDWITFDHISPIGFARYWIPELIEENRVIYLDCDMIVQQSLDELFELDLQGRFLAAVQDAKGIGFNSGMMVIDNEKWRHASITKKLIHQTIENIANKQNLMGDQEVLNHVLGEDWLPLEQQYNLQVGHDTYAFYGNWTQHFMSKDLPKVIHYTTHRKPWNSIVGYRYRNVWFDYLSLTYEQIQMHYMGEFDFKNLYKRYAVNLFSFTDSQDFLYMQELVESLPEVAFHIGAYTQMGDKLLQLNQYSNVYLYPEIVGDVLDELMNTCDAYLNTHFGNNQKKFVEEFIRQHKKILAFDCTSKNSEYEIITNSQTPEEMIQTISQLSTPLISVIIPIYNVQNYLEECITSVLNQTYPNFEVILVNDGSKDRSSEICEYYSAQDERIIYILQENKGVSSARNRGIEEANGDYVVFIDGDDIMDRHQLTLLYEKLVEYDADIAIGSYHQYSEQDGCFYIHFTDEDYIEKLYYRDELIDNLPELEKIDVSFVTPWGKLFKKHLFDHVKFPLNKLAEDAFIMYKLFLQCEKIIFVKKSLYMYRKHHSSQTGVKMSEDKLSNAPEARGERLALLAALGYDIKNHALWYRDGLKFSLHEAFENGLQNTETARRIQENLYFLEHYCLNHEDKSVDN